MTGSKSPLCDSSKSVWQHRKPSGEQVWTYAHNPYSNSAQNISSASSDSSNKSNNGNNSRPAQKPNVCRHYAEGRCNRGSTCRFYHDVRHTVIIATPHSTPRPQPLSPLTGLPATPLRKSLNSTLSSSVNGSSVNSAGGSDCGFSSRANDYTSPYLSWQRVVAAPLA
ncbi:uncharacterized protein TM35_000113390 [Trypanosoma theileri]|uniref:C3H1-type domain-containing protein n=1 Tax=Trypanosoma theileri TaxID=67003 RepID=A0A1X0NYP8_9TRYP|nr:uncharacterized protein TM35_000113390 [Trypanosoma theileri]ORC89805.1 hypothetical protein TM35_000113390 [Trypanosoma theileri]